jgi:hypothetical protein
MHPLPERRANRAAWAAELRSGKYPQIRGQLHDGVGYCCLGVACAMRLEPKLVREASTEFGAVYEFDGEGAVLHYSVKEWLGIVDFAGTYIDADGQYQSLTGDNDHRRFTFAQIADIIEAEPEGLFIND